MAIKMENQKYCYKYPHPAVTADCCVFAFNNGDPYVLLIQRKNEPYKNCWAFPGGFMEIDETIEQCAVRELREETGLIVNNLEQLGCFSAVDRDPRERVITITFWKLIDMQEVKGGDDATKAQWFKISELPTLAFDHKNILSIALNKLRE